MYHSPRLAFVLSLLAAVAIVSCGDDPPTGSQPTADTLTLSTKSNTSVEIKWSAVADVDGYTLSWMKGSAQTLVDTMHFPSTTLSTILSGLNEDTLYTFKVEARKGTTVVRTFTSQWRRSGGATGGDSLGAPTALGATSLSKTSVGLSWTKPTDTGVTGYYVSWKGSALGDSASLTVTSMSATATGLSAQEYTFYVRSMRGTKVSSPATIKWAGAERFTQDAATASTTIRMYEFQSASGSALVLDPALGGPRNASAATGNLGDVQLAMYVADTAVASFVIGPAYALTQFANADLFNQQTFISRKTFIASSLDDWKLASTLDTYIDNSGASAGNLIAFTLPQVQNGDLGQGFIVRTSVPGSGMHYARVFIKNVAGRLLQGTRPNRYVELQISYQTVANLPYAKGVVRRDSPTGVYGKRQ